METITLNDRTVVNGHILEDGYGQMIFVYLDGMNLMQGFMLMMTMRKPVQQIQQEESEVVSE